ncbi:MULTISPECIES: hypothetical protein [unclassified Burkholderia]|uniref:hypothetical protein n=1 Tax=unclassified Burkholderia TaxID=2613784 RepID=UPI00158A2D2C|nr:MULTISPECIES: hypothetical protein [unclassified Burkholderia]
MGLLILHARGAAINSRTGDARVVNARHGERRWPASRVAPSTKTHAIRPPHRFVNAM